MATCALGLELIVGRELEALGLGPIARQNAQVSFPYSPHALAKANYWLRSADRVARRGGVVRLNVTARQLRAPAPRQALLQAVDLTLAHGHRPAVYRWDADRVARAA